MQPVAYGVPGPSAVHPDQVIQALTPAVEAATRALQTGASLPDVLKEAMLIGYLTGRGMTPAGAGSLIQAWRMAGVTRELEPGRAAEGAPAPQRRTLLGEVRKNMQDEATAAGFYSELMRQAKDPAVKEYIRHARDDEQKHYRMLADLHRSLSGQTFEAAPRPVSFRTLREGLKRAMDDEYEAFEEYRTIYLNQSNEQVRAVFFELMTDELEHVTRFNYALQVTEE